MPGIERSDLPSANGSSSGEETVVRAFDCTDPMHDEAHFTAETGDVLVEKVLGHFAEYHPEIARDAVLQMLAAASYVETRADDVVT
jgi:hypothetical protein